MSVLLVLLRVLGWTSRWSVTTLGLRTFIHSLVALGTGITRKRIERFIFFPTFAADDSFPRYDVVDDSLKTISVEAIVIQPRLLVFDPFADIDLQRFARMKSLGRFDIQFYQATQSSCHYRCNTFVAAHAM